MTTTTRSDNRFRNLPSLLGADLGPNLKPIQPNSTCEVVAIEKRRDGKMRYWCRAHRADATAKGGKPSDKCRAAHIEPVSDSDTLILNIDDYAGGIALWGAVPAIYDTTRLPMDRGVHVHARLTDQSKKIIDKTFRAVRLKGKGLPEDGIVVNEIDAIYYMVSSVFGMKMSLVSCTHCRHPHLDKDWFSVHPHRRHLCSGCGRHFHDKITGIGNPIIGVRDACNIRAHSVKPAGKSLELKQTEFPGGIQIWGSNPAFFWTSSKPEEEGIHVHAFADDNAEPTLDDTYSTVTIDGRTLDPLMVRVLMAQYSMPSLDNRIRSISCPQCKLAQFDGGELAYLPSQNHTCSKCSTQFSVPGRMRNIVSNPLLATIDILAKSAPRTPQCNKLGLLPETL